MAVKQCIATGIRNINNLGAGNVFKECNIIVLPLLQFKGKTNPQVFTACTRKTITFTTADRHVQQITVNLYQAKTVPKTFPIIKLTSTTANDSKNIINSLSNQINCVVMTIYQQKHPKGAWVTIVFHTVTYVINQCQWELSWND